MGASKCPICEGKLQYYTWRYIHTWKCLTPKCPYFFVKHNYTKNDYPRDDWDGSIDNRVKILEAEYSKGRR